MEQRATQLGSVSAFRQKQNGKLPAVERSKIQPIQQARPSKRLKPTSLVPIQQALCLIRPTSMASTIWRAMSTNGALTGMSTPTTRHQPKSQIIQKAHFRAFIASLGAAAGRVSKRTFAARSAIATTLVRQMAPTVFVAPLMPSETAILLVLSVIFVNKIELSLFTFLFICDIN